MLATEREALARQFLVDADREWDVGDAHQASEKLWGAAAQVVLAEMTRRGLPTSGHRRMILAVQQFAGEAEDRRMWILFRRARGLHSNFYHGFLNDFQFLWRRAAVHAFVAKMQAFSEARRTAAD